jgi:Caspase domain
LICLDLAGDSYHTMTICVQYLFMFFTIKTNLHLLLSRPVSPCKYNYIQDFYGFQDQDVTVLADDGDHPLPTKAAILQAYRHVVAISQPGDSIFLHYSGHGTKVKDLNGDEDDGYDEAMVPLDFKTAGVILDDDLYDIFVKGLKPGVHVVALVS